MFYISLSTADVQKLTGAGAKVRINGQAQTLFLENGCLTWIDKETGKHSRPIADAEPADDGLTSFICADNPHVPTTIFRHDLTTGITIAEVIAPRETENAKSQ